MTIKRYDHVIKHPAGGGAFGFMEESDDGGYVDYDDHVRTVERYRKALERIERWFGEFPDSGHTWDDGTPMSYGAAFGSDGERDYMREVAWKALK